VVKKARPPGQGQFSNWPNEKVMPAGAAPGVRFPEIQL